MNHAVLIVLGLGGDFPFSLQRFTDHLTGLMQVTVVTEPEVISRKLMSLFILLIQLPRD